ncbi:hypothetical protein OCUBac02_48980 (plasmid) [Bosea sp. ANAM02]|nr:hypothetical protein OCUBac02_48980 [Bosea sp. ANAM02]
MAQDYWTPERVAKLKSHWDTGASATEIAAEFGGITKNVVIGKANRLGLARRAPGRRRGNSTFSIATQANAVATPALKPEGHLPLPYVDVTVVQAHLARANGAGAKG